VVLALRRQLRKNQLACLMLAQGVPLLLAGDEVGNSQGGNNNAYCQDNEIGWTDWSNLGKPDDDMTDFIGRLTSLRKRFPQLTQRHWVHGKKDDGSFGVLWLTPQATEMTQPDWNFPEGRFLAYALGPVGSGATLYIALNAAPQPIEFSLPKLPGSSSWKLLLNTAEGLPEQTSRTAGAKLKAAPRSVIALESVP
jgi:glycogen operon protein